jgi:catechol 2,3-dioxygenase-like lactoylglutathione lyase family enzyme
MAFDFFRNVFDHVQIGCSDWPESVRFYRTVTAPLGIPVVAETDEWVMFAHLAVRPDRPVTTNLHLSFVAPSREAVDEFHRAGVEAGFRDNGRRGCATRTSRRGSTRRICSTRTATMSRRCIARTWRRRRSVALAASLDESSQSRRRAVTDTARFRR